MLRQGSTIPRAKEAAAHKRLAREAGQWDVVGIPERDLGVSKKAQRATMSSLDGRRLRVSRGQPTLSATRKAAQGTSCAACGKECPQHVQPVRRLCCSSASPTSRSATRLLRGRQRRTARSNERAGPLNIRDLLSGSRPRQQDLSDQRAQPFWHRIGETAPRTSAS